MGHLRRHLLFFVFCTLSLAASAQNFEVNTNRFGGDFRDFDLPQPNPRMCYEACAHDNRCQSFTYRKPFGWQGAGPTAHCWLKEGLPPPRSDHCCISGQVIRAAVQSGGPPSIARVLPNTGPTAGGTRIRLLGSGFLGATRVNFGGNDVPEFRVVSDREIIAVLPPFPNPNAVGAEGYSLDAAVCTASGCSPQVIPGNFTYFR